MEKKYKIYRKILMGCLVISLCILFMFLYFDIEGKIPSNIHIFDSSDQQISFGLPVTASIYNDESAVEADAVNSSNIPEGSVHLDLAKDVTMHAGESGQYKMECKLFGVIPIKNVAISVVKQEKLIPAGTPIGIYMKTNGILVIGTGTVKGMDGSEAEPAKYLLKTGDYIESVNSEPVSSKKELIERISECGKDKLYLGIRRNEEEFPVKVNAVECSPGEYKIGVWVRDNTQGIGTLTYLKEDGEFGALGHGINDVDTAGLMELYDGALYRTQIVSIVKGTTGSPGELTGVINYNEDNVLGEITENTVKGIFGIANQALRDEVSQAEQPLEIGLKQEIQIGKANILSTVDGTTRSYEIEITKVDYTPSTINKGIVFQVTDDTLLEETGGIVQGMSGSPIIQNGKIIGAVTHVFVQDATKGFGIFIEEMIQ